jgi:hypothetical protein
LKNAKYVPPNIEDMTEAISDLDKFLNEEDELDPLINLFLKFNKRSEIAI